MSRTVIFELLRSGRLRSSKGAPVSSPAEVTIGYTPAGKRIVRRGSGKTKTAAKEKLKKILRDQDDGVTLAVGKGYTVAHAVDEWLAGYALSGHARNTVRTARLLAYNHIIPELGARRLVELTAEDVDR
jgi:hypothetical protein